MSDSFVSELQRLGIDPAVLLHAMRYFVAARAGDRPAGRMREDLVVAGLDADGVDRAVAQLQRDPALMEAAALAILQAGWEDPADRELARGALDGARAKLPIVEAALIAIVAVYGMWLTATKGRRTRELVIRRGPGGTWEEIEKTSWYGPSGPLEAIADVLGLRSRTRSEGGTDEVAEEGQPPLPPATESD